MVVNVAKHELKNVVLFLAKITTFCKKISEIFDLFNLSSCLIRASLLLQNKEVAKYWLFLSIYVSQQILQNPDMSNYRTDLPFFSS